MRRPIGRPAAPRQRRLSIPRSWTRRPRIDCRTAGSFLPVRKMVRSDVPGEYWSSGSCCDVYRRPASDPAYDRQRPQPHPVNVTVRQAVELGRTADWIRQLARRVGA